MFPPGPVLQAVPLWGGQEALLRPLRVPRDRGLAARQVLRPPGGPEPRQQGGKVRIDSYSRDQVLPVGLLFGFSSAESLIIICENSMD